MKLCPEPAQKALATAGGRNLQGKPLWKFVWSADATELISNGEKYERFRIVAEDCWLLMKWESSEPTEQYPNGFWGTEAEWRYSNLELPSGLLTAGPFPREGRYRVALKLRKAHMDGDSLCLENPIPTQQWVEDVFPMILAFDRLTPDERAKVLLERERSQKAALIKNFAASRKLYKGAATPKLVKAKEEAIQRWMEKNPKGYRPNG